MSETRQYAKRLIEIDLPIRRISVHSRAEKSVRQGHLSTLHVWWARRPLAACRSVIAASLWLDPGDDLTPESYCRAAREALQRFAKVAFNKRSTLELLGSSIGSWKEIAKQPSSEAKVDRQWLRNVLLDVVAIASSWSAASDPDVSELLEAITLAAHTVLHLPGPRPLVIDPFAGGGAMPLEALRVGADAYATDLNPIAVLLNRVALEYAPKRGHDLANQVRKLGLQISTRVKRELADLYPSDRDGSKPLVYLWARTISCEGPACGKPIPLARTFWLTKRENSATGVRLETPASGKNLTFTVLTKPRADEVSKPTVQRGAAICPWCKHTTPVERVRAQLTRQHGGADSATLLAVVLERPDGTRAYRAPQEEDMAAAQRARERLEGLRQSSAHLLPTEELPPKGTLGFRVQNYGMTRFEHLHSARQLVTLASIAQALRELEQAGAPEEVAATLSLALGRLQDLNSSLCTWADTVIGANRAQSRVSMIWDFAEAAPLAGAGGSWDGQVEWVAQVLEHIGQTIKRKATVAQAPAQKSLHSDHSAALLATDPPYYDAFGYADLSDLFFVWLKRTTVRPRARFAEFGPDGKTPKSLEIVVNPGASSDGRGAKDHDWFYEQMRESFAEARRVVARGGIGVIVFAHKDTKSWEALLKGVIEAGWIVTASWPIDTERPNRQRAQGAAALASSVHLVCRPRPEGDIPGQPQAETVGNWRDVLTELPKRMHEWLPRLADEGVVGADAIFACLGPALEIFSRYSRVEKVSGEPVDLPTYLESVWAAVSREALSMLFAGAETEGLEPDARVTAVWLWTLAASKSASEPEEPDVGEAEEVIDGDEGTDGKSAESGGFALEFDAARKIAQGLGAELAELTNVIAVKGSKARLLPVIERMQYLFAKNEDVLTPKQAAKKRQMTLFAELDEVAQAQGWGDLRAPEPGVTTLDRVHQAMLLFASGRSDALRRFLTQDQIGFEAQFWKLAQALSALYPSGSEEKRWVDGLLAYKKGWGLG